MVFETTPSIYVKDSVTQPSAAAAPRPSAEDAKLRSLIEKVEKSCRERSVPMVGPVNPKMEDSPHTRTGAIRHFTQGRQVITIRSKRTIRFCG